MKFKAKKVLLVTGVFVLAAAIYLYYGYLYKDARDISSEDAKYTLSTSRLAADYTFNPVEANGRYLNSTLEVTGVVTEVSDSVLTLDSTIFCGFNQPVDKDLLNKNITIKGRCLGYDELFNEVKLDECSIKNNNNL